ncbi:MAG: hypothetical protein H6599_09700 [Flavobacteriales bacterium]|nr:hypothetical protein [Flavobacteriales bacterium]
MRRSVLGLIFFFKVICSNAQKFLDLTPLDKDISKKIRQFISYEEGDKIIRFSSGIYEINETIKLSSDVMLVGVSVDSTILQFDLKGKENCIEIIGKRENKPNRIIENERVIHEGDRYYKIFNANPNLDLSEWGSESMGCMVKGKYLKEGVFEWKHGYDDIMKSTLGDSILCYEIFPVRNVSLRDFTIKRLDETSGQTSNIFMNYTADCEIARVESYNCNYSHVTLENSYNVKVEHCLFREGFSHGNGGKAYGVALQYGSSWCSIEGCWFDSLRHGVVLQLGVSLNSIVGNYFENSYWTEVRLPEKSAGDIVFHGNFPFRNQVSYNICNNIVVDNSHGVNGPNAIVHNRVLLYGIYTNRKSVDSTFYIGCNLINKGGIFKGRLVTKGKAVRSCGNYIGERLQKSQGDCKNLGCSLQDLQITLSSNDAIEYFGLTLPED